MSDADAPVLFFLLCLAGFAIACAVGAWESARPERLEWDADDPFCPKCGSRRCWTAHR